MQQRTHAAAPHGRTFDRAQAPPSARSAAVFASIDQLAHQVRGGIRAAAAARVPKTHRNPSHIVVCGMGGSALGAHILETLFTRLGLRIPLTIVNGYHLPGWVSRDALVIASSYSGGTAETLAAGHEALRRRVPLIAVTSGGKLARLAERSKAPSVVFPTERNPSGQPRLGIGYSLGAFMKLLMKMQVLSLHERDLEEALRAIERTPWRMDVPEARNAAKQDARALAGRGALIFAPDAFLGNAHAFANQLNETAKAFAISFPIPEAHHHLLEGLRIPSALRKSVTCVSIEPAADDPRVAKRFAITAEILRRQGFRQLRWTFPATPPLAQALRVLARGSYVSAYLSAFNRVDPLRIPWVDFLKEKMEK